jgi:hypothetical protein
LLAFAMTVSRTKRTGIARSSAGLRSSAPSTSERVCLPRREGYSGSEQSPPSQPLAAARHRTDPASPPSKYWFPSR